VGRFEGIRLYADEIAELLAPGETALFFQLCHPDVGERHLDGVDPPPRGTPGSVGEGLRRLAGGSPVVNLAEYFWGVSASGTPSSWAGRVSRAFPPVGTHLLITDRRLAFVHKPVDLHPKLEVLIEVPLDEVWWAERRWKAPMFGCVEIWFTDDSMVAVGLSFVSPRKAYRVARLLNE
jgi:hypothetical protein